MISSSQSNHLRLHHLLEHDPPICHIAPDDVFRLEAAGENLLRQRVFDLLLDGSFQRPGTIERSEALLSQFHQPGVGDTSSFISISATHFSR